MLCTDSLKDLTVHPVLANRIPAKNINCVGLNELIASFSIAIAASALPSAQRRCTHSAKIATRGCPTFAAVAALAQANSGWWVAPTRLDWPG
jgi:hypothetical protein